MSDELSLFCVLWLVYLTDCVVWSDRNSLVFMQDLGRRWKVHVGSGFVRTGKGGLMFLNPLPPWGAGISCHLMPLSLSPEGVCNLNAQALTFDSGADQALDVRLFAEMDEIKSQGTDLFINGNRFAVLADEKTAADVVDLLKTLAGTDQAKRIQVIRKYWHERFDLGSARMRLNRKDPYLKTLQVLCGALFIYLFVLSPIIVLMMKLTGLLVILALGMFFFLDHHSRFSFLRSSENVS